MSFWQSLLECPSVRETPPSKSQDSSLHHKQEKSMKNSGTQQKRSKSKTAQRDLTSLLTCDHKRQSLYEGLCLGYGLSSLSCLLHLQQLQRLIFGHCFHSNIKQRKCKVLNTTQFPHPSSRTQTPHTPHIPHTYTIL